MEVLNQMVERIPGDDEFIQADSTPGSRTAIEEMDHKAGKAAHQLNQERKPDD